ncbi:hypothetical protein FYK55_12785 [Roseiconus nitratireducens]|uniref:ASPIC/UnbV domain-containing protein n=1 Tax=Roseiconus nitratireducens TaxID=2605748 RepID=A0A5M6DA38_9BACT|nr:CRTAC1 family protein [Roseiconus nitratireducens]KAA5543152.1 hypothetical protein FYK55_12785 [Roseiconus nitratireducens]
MKTDRKSRQLLIVLGIAAVLAVAGTAYWSLRHVERPEIATPPAASEQTLSDFYTSIAALDVEENERAARVLGDAVQREDREPALWANLAVARLRLNEPEKAREALERALELAGDSQQLAVLNAQIMEYSGQIEPAIEVLRRVHTDWPENVAATYSLVSLLGQMRDDQSEGERIELLTSILEHAPGNLKALLERARIAATLDRDQQLRETLNAIANQGERWPEDIRTQLDQASNAADRADNRNAAVSLTFLENLLKPRPEYQRSLAQLGVLSVTAVGTPVRSPLRLKVPPAQIPAPDSKLAFEPTFPFRSAARPDFALAMEHSGERRSTLLSLSGDQLLVDASAALPFPGSSKSADRTSLCVADLNSDFRQDLVCVGDRGAWIYVSNDDFSFTEHRIDSDVATHPWKGVWAIDIEADGDLDLLLSDQESQLLTLRNDGAMTFTEMADVVPASKVVQLCQIDFDTDGDLDVITLDPTGQLTAWTNQRAGSFSSAVIPASQKQLATATGDLDRNGEMEVISLADDGGIWSSAWVDGDWMVTRVASSSLKSSLKGTRPGAPFLHLADMDNNGGVDVILGVARQTEVLLGSENLSWIALDASPEMILTSVVDYNDDGRLDLVGLSESATTVALNQSEANYGWHVLQPMANTNAGDKRINSFGIGGRIDVRAGSLVQSNPIASPRVHFGLGNRPQADVARVIWPNGTSQAEFGLKPFETLVANQRLKGSCPWVFAYDGAQFQFVKDFLWRSPLGLRINAQDTAGITQTEDWIRIPGNLLASVEGRYLIRITAELWETHFFDHVHLLAVDFPDDARAFVDERFIPASMPRQRVALVTAPKPLHNVLDHKLRTLDERLKSNDGEYADTFELGEFQGIAEDHWVQFDLPPEVSGDRDVVIVGHGWIYPTDSSLNVAIAQGLATRPYGLILEQQGQDGRWKLIQNDLGFPAGKGKDVLIAIPPESIKASRRYRLRTNMEVHWDSLRWSYLRDDIRPKITELDTVTSELRYRGYSRLLPVHRRRPDTPIYEIETAQPRWLDLEGFHTRHGDIGELTGAVDDRYAIVNAGDELVFEFAAIAPPPTGWRRDFVLVGDGWVKDGDFNTAFSKFVRPLPSHDSPQYRGPLRPLMQDPVHQKHQSDWKKFHTRYVTPKHFYQQLWKSQSAVSANPNAP